MNILGEFDMTYKIHTTRLDDDDTVACKVNTISKDKELEWKVIDRITELVEKNGWKPEINFTTLAFNEIAFKNKELGYLCEVTIPQITVNTTTIFNKQLYADSICRAIKNNNHILNQICSLIIKECFNIDSFETVDSDLFHVDYEVCLNSLMDRAEFKSDNRRIGILWTENKLDKNGYTMVFEAVIE